MLCLDSGEMDLLCAKVYRCVYTLRSQALTLIIALALLRDTDPGAQ